MDLQNDKNNVLCTIFSGGGIKRGLQVYSVLFFKDLQVAFVQEEPTLYYKVPVDYCTYLTFVRTS